MGLTHNAGVIPAVSTAQNTVYVAKYGKDENNGSSHEKAKLTLSSAKDRAIELGLTSNNRVNIFVLDAGDYAGIAMVEFLDLEAPCCTISAIGSVALETAPNSIISAYDVQVSGGGIALKSDNSSVTTSFTAIKKITALDTSDAVVCLEGAASICVDGITVTDGAVMRMSETVGPFASENTATFKFDKAMILGSGHLKIINGDNDLCLSSSTLITGSTPSASGVKVIRGSVRMVTCDVDLKGGTVWDVGAGGTLDFTSGNVVKYGAIDEFKTVGSVSSFITHDDQKRFKRQTTSGASVEVYRVSMPENSAYGFSVEALGQRDDGSKICYQNVQSAFLRDGAGPAERVGGSSGDGVRTTSENAYKISFEDDSTDAVISVVGKNGHVVNWDIKIKEVRKDV